MKEIEVKMWHDYYEKNKERIAIAQLISQLKKEKNQIIYKENIEAYEKWIEKIAQVVRSLSLPNNSISHSAVIGRIIKEGWLSKTLNFEKENIGRNLDIIGYCGIDVINGYGCCRHTEDIYTRIASELNIHYSNFSCYSSSIPVSIEEGLKNNTNHIINLFQYEGLWYGYDTLNQVFYVSQDIFRLKSYVREQETNPKSLFMKADYDMVYNNKTLEEEDKKIDMLWIDSTKVHISKKELQEILKETHNKYNKNIHILSELIAYTFYYSEKIIPKHLEKK